MTNLQARPAGCPTVLEFIGETLHQVATQDNELANPRGCLATNTATEFSQSDAYIARRVRKGLASYQLLTWRFTMTVSYVEREGADTLTNEFYDDAEQRFELLLNVFKVLGHTPKLGRIFTDSVMEINIKWCMIAMSIHLLSQTG